MHRIALTNIIRSVWLKHQGIKEMYLSLYNTGLHSEIKFVVLFVVHTQYIQYILYSGLEVIQFRIE